MCVVKVNRVESNTLELSKMDTSQSNSQASPVEDKLKADKADRQDLSVVTNLSPEGPIESPGAPHLEISDSTFSSVQQDLNSPLHTNHSAETLMDTCPPEPQAHVSASSSSALTLNTDMGTHTGTRNYTNDTVKAEGMDVDVAPEHGCPHSTTKALYEPAEGDSYTSGGTLTVSQHNHSVEKGSTEESLLPPLLQKNAADMPQLTPEPVGKAGISPLPPVLTQEMPSLTPANDELTHYHKTEALSHQVAPVLQRETPTGSPSLQEAREEGTPLKQTEPFTVDNDNRWNLEASVNREEAAASGLEANSAHLAPSGLCKRTSGDVHEMLIKSPPERDHATAESFILEQSDRTPQRETQPNLPAPNKENYSAPRDLNCSPNTDNVLQTPGSLLSPQHENPAALKPNNHTIYSDCSSQHTETRAPSSGIWKNFPSQSPVVLFQSLHPDLQSDFSHDPLPYTMWTEPQCKEVTDLEDPTKDLCRSEDQGDEGGALTWAQLEPTSLLSVSSIQPLGLCEDYELQKDEGRGAESMLRHGEAEARLQPENVVSLHRTGAGEQDETSDMEDEEESDCEDEEQQCSVKEQSSSNSSEEEEENDTNDYKCDQSGPEPGEVCAVSVSLSLFKPR